MFSRSNFAEQPVRSFRCIWLLALCLSHAQASAQLEYIRFDYAADDTTQHTHSFVEMVGWDNGEVLRVFQLTDASQDFTLRLYRTAADGSLIWARRIESPGGLNGNCTMLPLCRMDRR